MSSEISEEILKRISELEQKVNTLENDVENLKSKPNLATMPVKPKKTTPKQFITSTAEIIRNAKEGKYKCAHMKKFSKSEVNNDKGHCGKDAKFVLMDKVAVSIVEGKVYEEEFFACFRCDGICKERGKNISSSTGAKAINQQLRGININSDEVSIQGNGISNEVTSHLSGVLQAMTSPSNAKIPENKDLISNKTFNDKLVDVTMEDEKEVIIVIREFSDKRKKLKLLVCWKTRTQLIILID